MHVPTYTFPKDKVASPTHNYFQSVLLQIALDLRTEAKDQVRLINESVSIHSDPVALQLSKQKPVIYWFKIKATA